jgi:hypothetical protein
MLICGYQSIVNVTTEEIIPAEDGPTALVVFTVRVETYGFTATQQVRVEQRDARTFVSHLRAIERVRQTSATLSAPQKDEFELRIGFIPESPRMMVSGRVSNWDAGLNAPILDFGFEFDPATLPTIVAEAERWIAPLSPSGRPERDDAAIAFERQFLAWLHIRLGILPKPRMGTNAQWWTFEYNNVPVSFVIVGRTKNGAAPPSPDVAWLLRVEEPEPCAFIERVYRHFGPESAVRRRFSDGRVRVQFRSTALRQPFVDQAEGT